MDNVLIKGIPEPYSKRTVEGDLGMRYSLKALEDETDVKTLARAYSVTPEAIIDWVERCAASPDTVAEPGSQEQVIEEALAYSAVDIAVERHAGVISKVYTPIGEMFTLVGKDLTQVPRLIGIGGALINSTDPARILSGSRFNPQRYEYAKPQDPHFYLHHSEHGTTQSGSSRGGSHDLAARGTTYIIDIQKTQSLIQIPLSHGT